MLVDYAEEEYLDALGRNHGVSRTGYLTGDDTTFREVVKALSYNPRGTIYGMELALDALVGSGNYEIAEDLISNPCTVYISLVGSASTTLVPKGKAFIKGVESQPATGNTTVDVSRIPIAVGSVRWKDEDLVTQTQTQKPSASDLDEYDGDTGREEWTFSGTSEANQVTLHPVTTDSGCIEFTTAIDNSSAYYFHYARLRPESIAMIEVVATIPVGVNIHAAEAHQSELVIFDKVRGIGAGCIQIDANNFGVGLCNPNTGAMIAGSFTVAKGDYHTISIHKSGSNDIKLYVNGVCVQTATYASFPAVAPAYAGFLFGIYADPPTNNPQFRVRQVARYARTLTDYWSVRGTAGQVAAANPTRLNDAVFNDFQITDVGLLSKALSITGGTAANAQGGNNNGRFVVASWVSATAIELTGPQQEKADLDADLVTITVPLTGYQFRYPDDLGKKIAISGSALGNNGEYVITSLLSQQSGNHDLATLPGGGASLSTFEETTNICQVAAGFAAAEVDLDWLLKPVFVNEGPGLDWEMSDAGSFSGATLTLRQALPISNGVYTRVLDILFSDVLSAQVLLDTTVKNLLDAYYPFYIADPLGFVRAYLDTITAAGVIPDFEIT